MSEEQLKEAIQYNLDYLEGNIDFELEYKELAESYSKLYEELEAKSKMLVNRDKELISFSDEIERLNNIIKHQQEDIEEYNDKLNEVVKERNKYLHIINELEKYLEKIIIDGGTRGSMTFWYRQIYDYLQELKGDDK